MGSARAGQLGSLGQVGAQKILGSQTFNSWKTNLFTLGTSDGKPALSGNRRRFTVSVWTQVNDSSYSAANHRCIFGADAGASDVASRLLVFGGDASNYIQVDTSTSIRDSQSQWRDVTSWYHWVFKFDTTEASASNQIVTYINGREITSWTTETALTQNQQMGWNNSASDHMIGANPAAGPGQVFAGRMTQFYSIDGTSLGPENFGYTDPRTGIWRPKKFIPPYKPNRGQTWSGMCSGGTDTGNEHTKAFDGSDGTNCYPSPGSTVTMTIPAGQLHYKNTFEVWVSRDINGGNITVNGGGNVTPSGSGFQIVDLSGEVSAGTDITEITWARAGSGSIGIAMYYIMIDGVALFDDDLTNMGLNACYLPFDGTSNSGQDRSGRGNDWIGKSTLGSASLKYATGALPILKTTASGHTPLVGVREDVTLSTPGAVEGCAAFDGSSDVLSVPNSSDFSFGSGDFTVECWAYCKGPTTGTSQVITAVYDTSDNKRSWQLTRHGSGNNIRFYYSTDGSTGLYVEDSSSTKQSQWQHIAAVRESNTLTLYINGTSVDSATVTGSLYDNTSDLLTIGASDANGTISKYLDGMISNLRIVKGTAVYTANFTPPGKPLENITNTKLLCCQSSTMVGAALTAPTMGGLNDGTYWSGQGSTYTGSIWSDPQDTGGSGTFWPSSMFSGQSSGYTNNVGPYSSGIMTINFGKTWEGSTDFIIYGRLYQNDLYKDQDGNTLYTQGASGSGSITTRSFTASDVSMIIVDQQSGNGNSSFVADITVEGEKLRDPVNMLPGTSTNKPWAARSEAAGSLQCALPLNNVDDGGVIIDVSNSVNDNSSAKTATVTGASEWPNVGNYYDNSYKFDGTNDEIVVSDSTAFDVGNNDMTAECWWNIYSFSGNRRVFTSGNGTSSGQKSHFQLVVTSGGLIRFDYDTTAGYSLNSPSDIVQSNDTWHHTAIQRNSSSGTPTMEIYYDGHLVASTTSNASFDMNNSEGITLGRESTGSSWWHGAIQDFRFYNGVAKYQQDFVPASSNPSITLSSPSGAPLSSNVKKTSLSSSVGGSVAFDGSADYLSLAASSDFDLAGDFCIEAWVYRTTTDNFQTIIDARSDTSTGWLFWVNDSGTVKLTLNTARTSEFLASDRYLTNNCWQHVAMVRSGSASNNCKMYINGVQVAQGSDTTTWDGDATAIGYSLASGHSMSYWRGKISNLRLVNGSPVYIKEFTPPTAPLENITNTKLLCCQSAIASGSAAVSPVVSGSLNDGISWSQESSFIGPTGGGTDGWNAGAGPELIFDGLITTLANGAGSRDSYFVINFAKSITVSTSLEVYMSSGSSEFKVNDGSYGVQNSGAWRDLSFTGTLTKLSVRGDTAQTYGNYAPRLSAIRIDGSTILTNGINYHGDASSEKVNPFDTDVELVEGSSSNYPTWNPLDFGTAGAGNYENGMMDWDSAGSTWKSCRANFTVNSGKWYYEQEVIGPVYGTASGNTAMCFGWARADRKLTDEGFVSNTTQRVRTTAIFNTGGYVNFGGYEGTVCTPATGDIMACALDRDNNQVKYYLNGVEVLDLALGDTIHPLAPYTQGYYNTSSFRTNFGQQPFQYAPPEGHLPLCTANLPRQGSADGNRYVGITTYSGNGALRDIALPNDPDLVIIKSMSTTYEWVVGDSVRGSDKSWFLSTKDDEETGQSDIMSFGKQKISVGTNNRVNNNSNSFLVYSWAAGGSKNTFNIDGIGYASAADCGMDGGSITPTGCSVSTKNGFSIVKWTGTGANGSISHGLGQTPDFIMTHNLPSDGTTDTLVWNSGYNDANPATIASIPYDTKFWTGETTTFNNTSPTSSTFFVGTRSSINQNTDSIMAYLWVNIPGLQKFGQYEGNGSSNGPYVYLGFKPAFLLIKEASNGGTSRNWACVDIHRSPENVANHTLAWNFNYAESSYGPGVNMYGGSNMIDLLADGFKIRDTGVWCNTDLADYCYFAWADQRSTGFWGSTATSK